jgi:hypothetical protein
VVLARGRPGLEAGWAPEHGSKEVARSQESYDGRKATGVEARVTRGRRKGMGSTPTRAALFMGGPLNLPVAVPSAVQHAPTALFREVREKIKADFSLTD